MLGRTLAHYEITGQLGQGGMGEVYRARDTKLGREVALKVLPTPFAGDPSRLERFRREARTVAGLNHPHIVHLYSVEESEAPLLEKVGKAPRQLASIAFEVTLPPSGS